MPIRTLASLVLASLLASIRPAAALDLPSSLTRKLLGDREDRHKLEEDFSAEPLDNSVDPERYLVGGGDGFQIAIVGFPSHEYSATVNSDGNLYIGDFGEIKLGRITLAQALKTIRDKVHAALGKRYPVYVTLKKVKQPNILVAGALSSPGSYSLPGTARLLDALKAANDGGMPSSSYHDLRRVELRNGDSARSCDLLRFLVLKDEAENPYVYPGDHIELRHVDRSVMVAGEVFPPVSGRVPFRDGETLRDIAALLRLRSTADSGYYLVSRPGEPVARVPAAEAGGFALREDDVIAVPARSRASSRDTVSVTGEVRRRGTYPVQWGRTTAREVLEWAGGASPDADLSRAFIVRANKLPAKAEPVYGQTTPLPTGLQTPHVTAYSIRPEINTSLSNMVATNDYALIRLGKDAGKVTLEAGDELHVPRKESFVYLSGHVRNPGAYPYREGRGIDFYVDQAGGYSPKADKGNRIVMARYKEIIQFKDKDSVEQGDIIVVPASAENKKFAMIYLPVAQSLIALMSLAVTIFAVTR